MAGLGAGRAVMADGAGAGTGRSAGTDRLLLGGWREVMCGTPSAPMTTLGGSLTGEGAEAAATAVACFLAAVTKPWGVEIMPSGVGSGAA